MSEHYITQLSLINDFFNAISLMFFHEKRAAGSPVLGCCLIGVFNRVGVHAGVQGSVPGLGGLKEPKKCFFPIHV